MFPTLFHIRIVADFVGDGGLRSMARIHFCVWWQSAENLLERVDHLVVGAPLEVCTAYAHAEESVATECRAFLFAVECDSARGMAWGVENMQGVTAKGDDIVVSEIFVNGRHFHGQGDTKYVGCLLSHILHQKLIAHMRFGLQTEFTIDKSITHAMVKMSVCAEQMNRIQIVIADILGNGGAFVIVHHAAVDDDSLVSVVAHHITVLGEHITGETLDGDHIGR